MRKAAIIVSIGASNCFTLTRNDFNEVHNTSTAFNGNPLNFKHNTLLFNQSHSLSQPGSLHSSTHENHITPNFPTIRVEILSNNSKEYVACQPNSRTPVPFETEYFKGVVLLMLRTDPLDMHYHHMFSNNRYIIVDIHTYLYEYILKLTSFYCIFMN